MKQGTVDWKRARGKIVAMYLAGNSLRNIAAFVGCSHVTICARLNEWGVTRRQRGGIPPVKDVSGQRHGLLTVLKRISGSYPTRWLTQCDCGEFRKLTLGHIKTNYSCGCGKRKR